MSPPRHARTSSRCGDGCEHSKHEQAQRGRDTCSVDARPKARRSFLASCKKQGLLALPLMEEGVVLVGAADLW